MKEIPPIPSSSATYSLSNSRHQLVLSLVTPTNRELEQIQTGSVELALVLRPEMLLFFCQFQDQPWLFSSYQWHRTLPSQRSRPDVVIQALLQVHVIDAVTKQPYHTREILMSAEFTSSLCGALLIQAGRPWQGEDAYQHAMECLQNMHPTPESLLPFATARMIVIP